MRVCIEKATGILVEAQSGGSNYADLDILKNNAIACGYDESSIEVKYIDDAELPSLIKTTDMLNPAYVERQVIIQEKEAELAANPFSDITFEQAETWIDNNVTDLASAKLAMKKIVRLILARS